MKGKVDTLKLKVGMYGHWSHRHNNLGEEYVVRCFLDEITLIILNEKGTLVEFRGRGVSVRIEDILGFTPVKCSPVEAIL